VCTLNLTHLRKSASTSSSSASDGGGAADWLELLELLEEEEEEEEEEAEAKGCTSARTLSYCGPHNAVAAASRSDAAARLNRGP
jgi:hypothetical protein